MSAFLGYHLGVKKPLAAIMTLLAMLLLTPALIAQVHGLPPTATSLGPGGRVVSPMPPTATSIGPAGFGNGGFGRNGFGFVRQPGFGRHHHHNGNNFIGGFPVYFPWGVPVVVAPYDLNGPSSGSEEDTQYEPAPAATVFERGFRNSGARRYPERADDADDYPALPSRSADAAPVSPENRAESKPVAPPPASVLVFKDGRKVQVQNYAIVGETLYDFTPGHHRKVLLSELNLKATADANEDLGLDFQVPAKAE
jgi:hypothetical protein